MQHLTYSTTGIGEVEIAVHGAQAAIWGHIVTLQLKARLQPANGESSGLEVAPVDVYMAGRWLGTADPQPGQNVLAQRTYASTEHMALRPFLSRCACVRSRNYATVAG